MYWCCSVCCCSPWCSVLFLGVLKNSKIVHYVLHYGAVLCDVLCLSVVFCGVLICREMEELSDVDGPIIRSGEAQQCDKFSKLFYCRHHHPHPHHPHDCQCSAHQSWSGSPPLGSPWPPAERDRHSNPPSQQPISRSTFLWITILTHLNQRAIYQSFDDLSLLKTWRRS